jgi:hypothetical protein
MLLHVLEKALALDGKEKSHAVVLGEARSGVELNARKNENLPTCLDCQEALIMTDHNLQNCFSHFLHRSDVNIPGNVVGRTDKSTYEIDQDYAIGGRAKEPAN